MTFPGLPDYTKPATLCTNQPIPNIPITTEVARTTVRYSVYLHDAEPDPAALTRLGQSFNHPLIVAPARLQNGAAPTSQGFARSLTPNVALTALKQPEDGDGLIVRLAELNGKATEAEVDLSKAIASGLFNVCQTDLLEQMIDGEAKWDGSRLRVPIGAYGLVTVKLT